MKDREKDLAGIKASIELLKESKDKVMNHKNLDDDTKEKRCAEIDKAISENYDRALRLLNASREEVDNVKYGTVSKEYIDKYERRLKSKGITDEQLQRKEEVVVLTGEGEETGKRKRRRKSSNEKSISSDYSFDGSKIERLSDEEELMRKTLVKDDNDLNRRRHRRTATASDTPIKETVTDVVVDVITEKKVKPVNEDSAKSVVIEGGNIENRPKQESKRVLGGGKKEKKTPNFNIGDIPQYVQYDVLPLPSNGECYAHKKNRIPVSYLTASDENIIASPNMYRDDVIIDTILSRKVLDKDIDVRDLCKGDRDAIILWLRATGYGSDFPIIAKHPRTGKEYPINVKLDTFKYLPFNLEGDENGHFEYVTQSGDIIKFKFLSVKEEDEVTEDILRKTTDYERFLSIKYLNRLSESISGLTLEADDKKDFDDCILDIKDILDYDNIEFTPENAYMDSITKYMYRHTVSVNGNDEEEFVKNYIDNMRAKEAFDYRAFINDNKPGVNLKIKVNVPESDGGDSFETFLTIDNFVFSNV